MGGREHCLPIQLFEQAADWSRCLDESARVLRKGGALFLTTTKYLCPSQEQFDLPLYSWYPGPMECRDRCDLIDETRKGAARPRALAVVQPLPLARWLAHTTTASAWIFSVKR